jgi:DNA repair exonuclease SbcCD nuclease subunit
MKIGLINDTHAGARGDNLLFNEFFFKFWEGTFFPYLKENNIKHIVHLGDVVDRRKFINYVILNQWRTRFFDVLKSEGITIDVIVGNHDVSYKNTNEINAIDELFSHYKNIQILTEPDLYNYDGLDVLMVPWINSSNYEQSLEEMRNTKAQVVFGHFEIAGFEMDRGNVSHGGLDRNLFDKFDMVLSGHFHHKSSDGTIFYLGNQYEITWADYGDTRGFHVFDTATRNIDFVPNPNRMFYKVSYDDTTQDFEYWKAYDFNQHKNTFVKVVVVNKNNAYLFDYVVDQMYKSAVADVAIVEDFTEISVNDDDELVNQAEDTMTILSKYIDGLTVNVEPAKLKNLMRELYVESLNVEVTTE